MEGEDETGLAHWAAAKKRRETTDSLEPYNLRMLNQALDEIDQLELPPFDKEKSWQAIDQKRTSSMHRRLRMRAWTMTAAASFLVLIGIFVFTRTNQGHQATYGAGTLTVLADDRSYALFKRNSSLTYDIENPSVMHLEGSAYFHVEPGDRFVVSSGLAAVEVLGTSFEIDEQDQELTVNCYTGSVRVTPTNGIDVVLQPGEGIIIDGGGSRLTSFERKAPHWTTDAALQESLDFSELLQLMELEYEISLDNPDGLDLKLKGALPLDNFDLAMEILATSFDLEIIQTSNHSYVIKRR